MPDINHPPAAVPRPFVALLPGLPSFLRAKLAAALAFLFAVLLSFSTGAQMLQYSLLNNSPGPYRMTYGPDGAYWFAEYYTAEIGRMDTNGNASAPFVLSNVGMYDIKVGPDSNLWFTESFVDKIGRISPGTNGSWTNGVLTEFPIHPNVATNCQPCCLTVGSDGNLWFTEYGSDLLGVMNTNGQTIHEYGGFSRRTNQLRGIAAGPDGAIWFTEQTYGTIGRMTTGGSLTEYFLPGPGTNNAYANCIPLDIIAGTDGAMWFTEFLSNRIGRLTVTGNYSDFGLPTTSANPGYYYSQCPYFLTVGGDSNIWFTEWYSGNLSRITPSGFITEFPNPEGACYPTGLASGQDKNIWVIEQSLDEVGEFLLPTLSISVTNSQFVLSWPVGATDYILQGNSNLLSTNWINLTSPPPFATTNLYIYTNTTPGLSYFRLYQDVIP